MLLGLATLVVAVAIAKTMPANWLMDFLSIVYRALYRAEVKGVENLQNAGVNPIIALNHVSFLDAGLALSLLGKEPVFAIDSAMAKNWWVKPFLRFTRAMPLDPTKPMATRTLIYAVREGNPLIIFPEGRITVTGSLMKVYDGAGLIADKIDAFVVPVRIDGLRVHAVHPAVAGAGAAALVSQGHGDRARAGQAHGRSGAQGQVPPPGGGRGALRDHVESRVPHHVDRSHRGRSAGRGRRDPRHGPHRGGRSGRAARSAIASCCSAPPSSAAS